MVPKKLVKNDTQYKLIKVYENFALYQNEKTGVKECVSNFNLGLIEEKVKPERMASKGGSCKC